MLQILFGKRLKELRTLKQITQKDLAKSTGLSVGFISNLERGVNAPSFSALEALSLSLGIPARDFFVFPENIKDKFQKE